MSQAAYRAVMNKAATTAGDLMSRAVRRAATDMPAAAANTLDIPEREWLREASRVLLSHEAALVQAFPPALVAAFSQGLAGDSRRPSGVTFAALELMGDDQVQENVEALRAQQVLRDKAESAQMELDALVCAALGLVTIQPQRNVLRVETYVRALSHVINQAQVSAQVRRRWNTHLAAALGAELSATFQELSQSLRDQGVGGLAQPGEPEPEAHDQDLLTVHELRKLLAGKPVAPPPAPEFSMTMPAALEKLQELQQVEPVIQRLRQRGFEGASSRSATQALAIEVVRLMVDNIASDPRLLAPVRQAVRDLGPGLMRLARDDARFFSDRGHPARQLLDEVTSRSLAWPSEDAPGFSGFMGALREGVDALCESKSSKPEAFELALHALREAWGQATVVRQKAVRALEKAERRNLLASQLAADLEARPDVRAAPSEVRHFITGPWAQVMAQARLAGSAHAAGHEALVADLAWSCQPALAGSDPDRLARVVEPLREHIARGLDAIGYAPDQARRFLDHVAALQREGASGLASARSTREQLEAQFDHDSEAGTWLAPSEARDSAFMAAQPPAHTEAASAEGIQPALPDDALREGAWVDMEQDGKWSRWQLTWASPHGTLFLFTHASGRQQSTTRRVLDDMLKADTLRLVTDGAVVDGALDAVALAALRNTAGLR